MKTGTTTAEALLGMLSLRPMSGYELRQTIEGSIGNFWSESFGQIYPTLKKLEQDDLVSVEEGERAGSKVYSLTKAGSEHLRQWLTVMPQPQVARNELLLKLFFGNLQPVEQARAQVEDWNRREIADLARYESILRTLQREHSGSPGLPFWLMTVRYGMAQTRALIGWCEETMAVLDGMAEQAAPRQRAEDHAAHTAYEEVV